MRALVWLRSTRKDLRQLPADVQEVFAYALQLALEGGKHPDAKPLTGFRGAGVLEVVEDYETNTFRAVYTVRFRSAVYVLHVFQKKSRHGRETARQDIDLIKQRLREAEQLDEDEQAKLKQTPGASRAKVSINSTKRNRGKRQ